ncbi:MAG: Gfo/Idh/MocA family oxidoreductase [Kofleriaceae bacterium]|nr:Gfo/Idh/MocA family oxidoreductase [Kofleriaceae bacterium]
MPRLGYLGVGWIGRHRMEAIARHTGAEVVAIADPDRRRRETAVAIAPNAQSCEHLGQLLELDLDGIVIATPSALHAEHSIAALERGVAVFCQKPLGRSAVEARRIVDTARSADRLLGVDLSYRHTTAVQKMREVIRSGGVGRPYAVDLVFHNAYGPDAEWFYKKDASGGGCVIDLGVHLVDLALWLFDYRTVVQVDSMLHAGGRPLVVGSDKVEDYASVQLQLDGGISVRLACSWRISAGRDAVIEASIYGTAGGVALHNVNGSFYDFIAERFIGTSRERIASPPDDWGGRAAIAWVRQLAREPRFDPEAERLVQLAGVLDRIYDGGSH